MGIEEVSPVFVFFFLVYVAFVVFAVMRIITALFLRDTLKVASSDDAMIVKERIKSSHAYEAKMKDLFATLDLSGDGIVSIKEFRGMLTVPEVMTYFALLEIDISDIQDLFEVLDNGDGYISYSEFMRGMSRIKGVARSLDVVTNLYETGKISKQCKKLEDLLQKTSSAALVELKQQRNYDGLRANVHV